MGVTDSLRGWLQNVEKMGELKKLDGADRDLEIGCIDEINNAPNAPALLFDNIVGYPAGHRVLSSSIRSASRVALTYDLPVTITVREWSTLLREKLPRWTDQAPNFPPEVVTSGPVLENVLSGAKVNLLKFPVPKWHELDGGRYIGTADVVITRDPDSGEINLGTYRIMVHDEKTTALYISPGKHGRTHYEKYHARGERCPVAVSVGHHPLLLAVGSQSYTTEEYNIAGAIRGKPIEVIKEEATGLPIPADSEIVIAGWCPPGKTRTEGPFGEWTGYYASKDRPAPIIEVERIYHRHNPIILGSSPCRQPSSTALHDNSIKAAIIYNDMVMNGVPDIRDVWIHEATGPLFIVISLRQRFAGHAKRAALLASQSKGGAYFGRYVVVVDEDIDPGNINDVLWAMAFRSDPEKDIDIIRKAWSTPLDPMIRKPATAFFNSRAIIDACKPYEWIDEFPKEVKSSPELVERVRGKW